MAKTERGLGTARARLGAVRARLSAARALLTWGGFAAGRNPRSIYKRNLNEISENLKMLLKKVRGAILQKKSL